MQPGQELDEYLPLSLVVPKSVTVQGVMATYRVPSFGGELVEEPAGRLRMQVLYTPFSVGHAAQAAQRGVWAGEEEEEEEDEEEGEEEFEEEEEVAEEGAEEIGEELEEEEEEEIRPTLRVKSAAGFKKIAKWMHSPELQKEEYPL